MKAFYDAHVTDLGKDNPKMVELKRDIAALEDELGVKQVADAVAR